MLRAGNWYGRLGSGGIWGSFAAHVQNGGGRVGGLLLAQAFERGVSLDEGRVHGLRVTRDQASGHALGKDVLEQVHHQY